MVTSSTGEFPLAAAGDTWGISGPTFLLAYGVLAGVFLIGAVLHRRRVLSGPADVRPGAIGSDAVAYLNGGPWLAIYASFGALRTAGAITILDGKLAQTGALPSDATALDQAVYHAADRNIRPRALLSDSWVATAIEQLRDRLELAELTLTAERRRSARTGALVLLALVVFGVVRVAAGLANNRPVGFLAAILLVVGPIALLLLRVPRRTRAGDFVLKTLRKEHENLAPIREPSWSTYGPGAAALGVGLFGTAALWTADPTFAAEAEIQRQYAAAAGSGSGSYYGSSGSGDSGSSNSGGGSSCSGGGGGCGGGGCGG